MRAEPARRARLLAWALPYAPAAALALLLPKCPLCIAAQLALLGIAIPLPSYARALVIAASLAVGAAVTVARWKNAGRGTIDRSRPHSVRGLGCCGSRC